MVEEIQNHIGGLNWGYRTSLRDKQVTYLNEYATFVDAHTIKTKNKKGVEKTVTAKDFIVATGGRPRYFTNLLNFCKIIAKTKIPIFGIQ